MGAVCCAITEQEAGREGLSSSVAGSAGLPLVYGSRVDTEHRGLQASGGVVEVWLFDPQQGHPILPIRVLAGVPALEAHQQDGDDEDAEDGERVEEDEVEERVIGADDGLQRGTWNRGKSVRAGSPDRRPSFPKPSPRPTQPPHPPCLPRLLLREGRAPSPPALLSQLRLFPSQLEVHSKQCLHLLPGASTGCSESHRIKCSLSIVNPTASRWWGS